jgi:SAM-dependent methyltransferase
VSRPFKDHFSGHSDQYARFRPRYPETLFPWLASLPARQQCAWDCGTGSGQAAIGLAECFESVIATDASADQIARAEPHPRVQYAVAPAEHSGLADRSVDLIAVAQALHWFDLERFYAEVRRVARPGGVFAGWCYGLSRITPGIDAIIEHLYADIVGGDWPPERRFIEEQFRTLPMPFSEITAPAFAMTATWRLGELTGYLGTWSAVQRFRKRTGSDPLAMIAAALREAWGAPELPRSIEWPLYFRIGRITAE